ncbi:MAG TPA: hypothetical protein VH143_29760 [Kofleriaceae bacterium]|nr:hypothetical protein [Kofleriaceae bacterium]
MKTAAAIALGIAVSIALVHHRHATSAKLVPEDASAPLRRIAIHYAPNADRVALPIWKQLFAALPASIDVQVEVAQQADFDRLLGELAGTPNLSRMHPVIVGTAITTWSRDRYAALDNDTILAPPRVETAYADRAGDASSAAAISHALYHREPNVAGFAFEGGDLAATPRFVFADANLAARNLTRGDVDRAAIEHELARRISQQLIWLGDQPGDVPQHHIMMYMMPLDDTTIAVGDIRAGVQLLANEPAGDLLDLDDTAVQAARFDRAAAQLVARGFKVVRVPALVLDGGGAFVTYTNALFDRRGDTRIVYLPTYALPVLDLAAQHFYESQGFEVHPIDVSSIYKLDGSLGCLVNVLER